LINLPITLLNSIVMSSSKYDNDCSIIKQPVSTDEFKIVIDTLLDEIANLKKEIELLKPKNKFIIDLVKFDKEDEIIEAKNKELLLYLKSLIETQDFKRYGKIEIKYELNKSIYENIRDRIAILLSPLQQSEYELLSYLKRRNLSFMFPRVDYNPHSSGFRADYNPDFFLITYDVNRLGCTSRFYEPSSNCSFV